MTALTIADLNGAPPSPLILSDRLITLAQEADRAGYAATAQRLVRLACAVFDEHPSVGLPPRLRRAGVRSGARPRPA